MTDVATTACATCGAANDGTRFCETCGADQQTLAPTTGAGSALSTLVKLRIATVAGALLVATVPAIALDISYATNDYSLMLTRVVSVLLVVITAGVAFLAARMDGRPGAARTGALWLAGGGGVLIAVGAFFSPTTAEALWLFLYFSWALSARFRGFGYFGLLAGVVVSFLVSLGESAVDIALQSFNGVSNEITIVIADAVVLCAVVFVSPWFERIHARRPVVDKPARVAPAQFAASYGTSGQPGMPGAGYGVPVFYQQRTNGFAVASLVLGLCTGTLLAVIFGHIALSQIRRTGAPGRGMAIAGLVLGYIWTAVVVIYLIVLTGAVYRILNP
jgi:hypothetical protein